MEETKYSIINGIVCLVTFIVGFWAGYYDVIGFIKNKLKKKKNFCEEVKGRSPTNNNPPPNNGNDGRK
jgi:hypothetical protein